MEILKASNLLIGQHNIEELFISILQKSLICMSIGSFSISTKGFLINLKFHEKFFLTRRSAYG